MKRTREKEHKSTKMRKKENSPQRPRKRRKFAATLVAFVVSALIFANRICDIQSTSIPSAEAAEVAAQQTASQGAHQANELSAVAQPSSGKFLARVVSAADTKPIGWLNIHTHTHTQLVSGQIFPTFVLSFIENTISSSR